MDAFEDNKTGAFALAKSGLNATELFLMNGFRTMFSAKLTALISEWLKQKLMVLVHADAIELVRKFTDPKKKSIYVEKTLNEAAINFGINYNALGYVIMDESHEAQLFSLFDGEKKTGIPSWHWPAFILERCSEGLRIIMQISNEP